MNKKLLTRWQGVSLALGIALVLGGATIAATNRAPQVFEKPQQVAQVYTVLGIENYFLSLASGAPTLTNIQLVGVDGRVIQFEPGVADQGTVVLDATPTSFKDLWETATSKDWDSVMAQHWPIGIVSATVGNTGTAAYTIGAKSTTDHKTFAVGVNFRLGPGHDYAPQVEVAAGPALVNTVDAVAAAMATDVVMDGLTALTPKYAIISATSTDNTIVAAVADRKIRVLGWKSVATADQTQRWEDGAGGTALTGVMSLLAGADGGMPFNPLGWFETGVNTLLNLELSSIDAANGFLIYVEVP